jgi:hypothetical protein
MPKYGVSIPIYASAYVEVEADSEEEAIEKAEESYHVSLCHQCAREVEIGEFDDSASSEAYLLD